MLGLLLHHSCKSILYCKVREIPGKGLGCVATRGIEPGELVVQDYPILTLEHDYKVGFPVQICSSFLFLLKIIYCQKNVSKLKIMYL